MVIFIVARQIHESASLTAYVRHKSSVNIPQNNIRVLFELNPIVCQYCCIWLWLSHLTSITQGEISHLAHLPSEINDGITGKDLSSYRSKHACMHAHTNTHTQIHKQTHKHTCLSRTSSSSLRCSSISPVSSASCFLRRSSIRRRRFLARRSRRLSIWRVLSDSSLSCRSSSSCWCLAINWGKDGSGHISVMQFKTQAHERLKRTLFIMTNHNMQVFGGKPPFQAANQSTKAPSVLKKGAYLKICTMYFVVINSILFNLWFVWFCFKVLVVILVSDLKKKSIQFKIHPPLLGLWHNTVTPARTPRLH